MDKGVSSSPLGYSWDGGDTWESQDTWTRGVSTCSSTHPRMFWDGRDTRGMGEICVEGGGSSLHPGMFLGMG